jgi:hypothetical protein
MSAAAEGIVTVKVDMLPSDRGDFFEKSQCLGAFGRLILVEEPRKDRGVVINDRIWRASRPCDLCTFEE